MRQNRTSLVQTIDILVSNAINESSDVGGSAGFFVADLFITSGIICEYFELVQQIMVDGDYTGERFFSLVANAIGSVMRITQKSVLKNRRVTPQRWVI